MKHHKILILSTYPIKNPQHGGQKRTAAIYKAYQENFTQVEHSAVFFRGFYADYDKNDISLGSESETLVTRSPFTGDIVCGDAIFKDAKVKNRMIKLLTDFVPDIIHIEQPFPYLGLKPLLKELGLHPKLIFGSQNIEASMKREILEGVGVPETIIAEIERQIHQLETDLTQTSDLVIACTPEDEKTHLSMGAKRTVLASNGIAAIRASRQAHQYWHNKFNNLGVKHKVLFVGSAHPPNWTGFLDMVGKGLGFVSPDTRIVMAGSICDYFKREIKSDNFDIEDATFWLRAFSAGRLSEDRLSALIEQADVILLPITEGGGSNLKTAEAILANKKVVATTHALRSFEWFKDFPGVWIADNPKAFRAGIQEALSSPLTRRTPSQDAQATQVKWDSRLKDMVKEVSAL